MIQRTHVLENTTKNALIAFGRPNWLLFQNCCVHVFDILWNLELFCHAGLFIKNPKVVLDFEISNNTKSHACNLRVRRTHTFTNNSLWHEFPSSRVAIWSSEHQSNRGARASERREREWSVFCVWRRSSVLFRRPLVQRGVETCCSPTRRRC